MSKDTTSTQNAKRPRKRPKTADDAKQGRTDVQTAVNVPEGQLDSVPGKPQAFYERKTAKGVTLVAKSVSHGRPSDYTPELATMICEMISEGMSLRRICSMPDMPSLVTVYAWMGNNESFLKLYTRAKDESAETLAESIIDIAQDTLAGKYDPQSARVAVDALKWTAAKLKPKKYGDNTDATPAIVVAPMVYIPQELPAEQIRIENVDALDGETA